MPTVRQSYVKPLVTHLVFTSDTKVNMLQTCKTANDNSGPSKNSCLSDCGPTPTSCCQTAS